MGGERTTVLNLEVVEIDAERGVLMLRGAVPGAKGAVVLVRRAVKAGG
jgi:large subunit ribosomal protein L3